MRGGVHGPRWLCAAMLCTPAAARPPSRERALPSLDSGMQVEEGQGGGPWTELSGEKRVKEEQSRRCEKKRLTLGETVLGGEEGVKSKRMKRSRGGIALGALVGPW